MPSASPISVSVRPPNSIRRCQSALLRARRETSSPSTRPTWAVSRAKPDRATKPEPESPRSSSMTTMRSAGQPSSRALAASAYCRSVDSRLFSTWAALDWRRYTIAWRERWLAVILARSFIASLPLRSGREHAGDEKCENLERRDARGFVELLPRRRQRRCWRGVRGKIGWVEEGQFQLHDHSPFAAPTRRVGRSERRGPCAGE